MSVAVLLDTHVFLWTMSSPANLSRRAAAVIEQAPHLFISAITGWEIMMLARKGRIDLGSDPSAWIRDAVASLELIILPLSLEIALTSESLVGYPRPDPADRFIIATALRHDLPLVTADQPIRDWGGVQTLW